MFAAALNVILAVLLVPWELIKMAKMFGEVCQQLKKCEDDNKESEISRAVENTAIQTSDNDTIKNDTTEYDTTEYDTTEYDTTKYDTTKYDTTKNETIIESTENKSTENTSIETETSYSSGYDTDDQSIQFNIIKTPPGVKSRVVAFRRGLVKKNSKIFEYCG